MSEPTEARDLTTGRLPATPAGSEQPLPGDQNDRPVVDRETARETSGVHIEALCEPCGVWHSVTVKPMRDGADPIIKVRPVCWLCGHRPLVTIGSGRV